MTQEELVNVLRWEVPSSGPTVVEYKIYRDPGLTDLAGVVKGGCLKFKDHSRKKGVTYTYYVVAEGEFGGVSTPSVIEVLPL